MLLRLYIFLSFYITIFYIFFNNCAITVLLFFVSFILEGKGWMHFNWLDSFNVAIFKLRSSSVNEVLRGARKIWVKIRWGQGCNDIQHTIGAYKFRLVPQA